MASHSVWVRQSRITLPGCLLVCLFWQHFMRARAVERASISISLYLRRQYPCWAMFQLITLFREWRQRGLAMGTPISYPTRLSARAMVILLFHAAMTGFTRRFAGC